EARRSRRRGAAAPYPADDGRDFRRKKFLRMRARLRCRRSRSVRDAGIAAPDLDADAFLPVHPGAAAFFNGTQESFMDRYGNVMYLTPMLLGAFASVFAAAWRFLGVRWNETTATTLDALCVLTGRIL